MANGGISPRAKNERTSNCFFIVCSFSDGAERQVFVCWFVVINQFATGTGNFTKNLWQYYWLATGLESAKMSRSHVKHSTHAVVG